MEGYEKMEILIDAEARDGRVQRRDGCISTSVSFPCLYQERGDGAAGRGGPRA